MSYVQVGLLVAILINSKAVDFIVTGCGTGEGAMFALNSFPIKDMPTILKEIDQEFLYETINTNQFKENFFKYAEDGEIKDIIKKVLKIA